MIDVENEIFTRIATVLREKFPDAFITGEKVAAPKSYPCVSIEEADNYSHNSSQDSGSNENYANLMYEVQVFSNKANGKKSQCKEIFAVCDGEFLKMGFTRTMKQPIPMDDAISYQLFGRYEAVISTNKTIFRR